MKIKKSSIFRVVDIEIVVAVIFVAISIVIAVYFYSYLNAFHANNLKKYLVTIARTAALKVDSSNLEKIYTTEDMDKQEFLNLVNYLQEVRDNNDDIEYVYIMRKSQDQNILEFIVDADSLTTKEEADENNNGIIEPFEEISLPGDKYDISEIPAMNQAFYGATSDSDITVDQWGKLISAYAPIYNSNNEVVAILGVDLKAQDYYALQRRTDFGLFILIGLFSLILILIYILTAQYRKEIKILKELDQQKSDFIALASHQLRTPLSASKWCINMLSDGDYGEVNERYKKAIGNLCSTNERMVNLVNDLLKVSQIDAQEMQAQFVKANVKELCASVISGVDYLIKQKKIIFNHQISENIKFVKTDPNLLKEVLLNLLNNAVKYTPEDKLVELNVYVEGKNLFFQIKDQGYGIPQKDHNRIFSKFFRSQNIIKKDVNGTGLGLYFVKKVIFLLGGGVTFKSKENQGTEFILQIPYQQ